MESSGPSLWLLIDGYNVIAPTVPPSHQSDERWLQRERSRLIDRLAKQLDESIRRRTCVVFDAAHPPPDQSDRYSVADIEVRFAVGYPEADDLIEELIAAHSAPKQLAVVSSDRRIQTAASRRGCTSFESDPWLDQLLDGKVQLAVELDSGAGQGSGEKSEKPRSLSAEETQRWLDEFGF